MSEKYLLNYITYLFISDLAASKVADESEPTVLMVSMIWGVGGEVSQIMTQGVWGSRRGQNSMT